MKKVLKSSLLIIATISVLFLLTGCGSEKEKDVSDKKEEVDVKQEEQSAEFSMGEWKNNVYENKFLGVRFNLPEGWTYSSDEEIAEMMNVGAELLNDDQKVAAEISKLTNAYYMLANDPDTGNNISIISEKPTMEYTVEFYINQLKTQLSSIETIDYEIGETSKETVSGIECDVLSVDASMSGVEMIQKYYIYKIDKYFICIIATSTSGETGINNIMESFE